MSLDYPDRREWLKRRASLNWSRFQKSRHRILHRSVEVDMVRDKNGIAHPVVMRPGKTYRRVTR